MRSLLLVLLLICSSSHAQQHCGYDFTSYIVLHIHEDGNKDNITDLSLTIVDLNGHEVINTDNRLSWVNNNEPLRFNRNHMIDDDRWYFPHSKDTYLLSVTNTFPADEFQVRIVDKRATPVFEPTTIPLYSYNMFVLCSSEQQKVMQFGRRVNKPIDVVLTRKK